jgi:hypothetical protein
VIDLQGSDRQWGVRGAQFTSFGVIEGAATPLFVRMAMRAGSLFDERERQELRMRVLDDILARARERDPTSKPTAVTNQNPLAVWLNYLLYHLSLTDPDRVKATKIEPEPFALSLLALERLAAEPFLTKVDRSSTPLEKLYFRVALSFPGERRGYAANVASLLRRSLEADAVFYDFDYQAQLARPNMDILLQDIYRNRCELVVVFLCAEYANKQWCGLEWRAVRDLIKNREDARVMLVRFDDANIDGTFSLDGFIDARQTSVEQLSELVLQRLACLPSRTS